MATNINKIIKTCKPFWPASEDFVNSATVFVNSATPRGHAPAAPFIHFLSVPPERKPTCQGGHARGDRSLADLPKTKPPSSSL